MTALMTDQQQHTHVWTRENFVSLRNGLYRLEERCACGTTRTRIGYPWNQRRKNP